MASFTFSKNLPEVVEKIIKSHEKELVRIVPHWITDVKWFFEDTTEHYNDNTLAYVVDNFDYWKAGIYICPPFLTATPNNQRACLIHEISHLPISPLTDWTKNKIKELFENNPALKDVLLKEVRSKTEQATQGITLLLQQFLSIPSSLYYESHVTIESVFDAKLEKFKAIAEKHGFKVAKLLMQKTLSANPEISRKDSFCTAHSENFEELKQRMTALIDEIQSSGFMLYRYKIESVVLDVRL